MAVSQVVDPPRHIPPANASAWAIDLALWTTPCSSSPLREDEARTPLVCHLVEISSIPKTIEAERAVANAPADPVGVVW